MSNCSSAKFPKHINHKNRVRDNDSKQEQRGNQQDMRKENRQSDRSVKYQSSAQTIEYEIRLNLKLLVQQKDYLKKLMISCILSSLYIQQYNYQQAHKILLDVERTVLKLDQLNGRNSRVMLHEEFQLAVIKIKMYTNLILVEIVNLQVEAFEQHLGQVLTIIQGWRNKAYSKHTRQKETQSQNISPNSKDHESQNKQKIADMTVMLFQLFLKGLSGFQSFQQIQAQTLIAQCNIQKKVTDVGNAFYFSTVSLLKLLESSNHQSAYMLQVHSYEIIKNDIIRSRSSKIEVSLRQVILKTVTLKKLIYLSQQLQLPNQIIKNYKQQLNSSQALRSKYLEGLQENTIFRNYCQKIDLGFMALSKLKQFEKQIIQPMIFQMQTCNALYPSKDTTLIQLWEYKALKNKFIQVLGSKALQNDQKTKQNILLMVGCMNKAIADQGIESYNSRTWGKKMSVQQMISMQDINRLKDKKVATNGKGPSKSQGLSLYQSAILQYKHRLQILATSISKIFVIPYVQSAFDILINSQPQVTHQLPNQGSKDYSALQSDEESQPSIYLQDVEFKVIDNSNKVQNNKHIQVDIRNKKQTIQSTQSQGRNLSEQNKYKHYNQNTSGNQHVQKISPKYTNDLSSYEQNRNRTKIKNIYLNDKNQVYMNYAQLGSRVKLNQSKPRDNQPQFCQQSLRQMDNIKQFQNALKKSKVHQSIRKQQGQIQIPNQEGYVKFIGKKYPFEQRQISHHKPLSHFEQSNTNQPALQIIEKYSYQRKNQVYLNLDQNRLQHKPIEEKSVTKFRNPNSSLSPRVPKETTIGSRLNEHVRKHELTYSPSSAASRIRQKQNKQVEDEKSQISDNQSVSEKSKNKFKSKVQKAAGFPKSPKRSQAQLQNKIIKFRDFMQGLQQSGIKVKDSQNLKTIPSRPKVQSKDQNFKPNHRRIATQFNKAPQQNHQSHITDMNQTMQHNKDGKNILQYFLSEIPSEKYGRIQNDSPKSKGSWNQNVQRSYDARDVKGEIQSKNSQSQLIKITSSQLRKQPKKQSQIKSIKLPQQQTSSQNSMAGNNKNSKTNKSHSGNEQKQKAIINVPFSPSLMTDYVIKMMKSHKQKLKDLIRFCENGQYIDKKHYTSDGGQQRFLRLSADHKFIQWAVSQDKLISGNKKQYEMKNIRGVAFGRVTDTMSKSYNKNLEPYKCFSLIFQKRTFDIYIPDEQDSKFWLPGISYFVGQARPQLNHPNYTTKIQKFIRKRQKNIQKDQFRQNYAYYSLGRVLWKRALLKMQHLYLSKNKKKQYKNNNAGAIIQFRNALLNVQKSQVKNGSMLPPTGKESKSSKQKSVSPKNRNRN